MKKVFLCSIFAFLTIFLCQNAYADTLRFGVGSAPNIRHGVGAPPNMHHGVGYVSPPRRMPKRHIPSRGYIGAVYYNTPYYSNGYYYPYNPCMVPCNGYYGSNIGVSVNIGI